jgi:5-enolpyruvylshikimate-3-phosphate synthase
MGVTGIKSVTVIVTCCRYVRMTCSMMNEFGCSVKGAGNGCWVVPRSGYNQISFVAEDVCHDNQRRESTADISSSSAPRRSSTYTIEPDASSATYFLAMAAVTGALLRSLLSLYEAVACILISRMGSRYEYEAVTAPRIHLSCSSSGGRVVARGLLPAPSSMQGDSAFYE